MAEQRRWALVASQDLPSAVGKRRWHVAIGRRDQQPGAGATALRETLVEVDRVWANILPIGAITFYGAQQTDTPITHRVWCRWLDWIDNRHVVIRDSKRPDGTTRRELYRIRRVIEDQGRKRFTMLEVELEEVA